LSRYSFTGWLLASAHYECCVQAEVAVDMRQRYVGHCNTGTDIKQASFLGEKGLCLLPAFPPLLTQLLD